MTCADGGGSGERREEPRTCGGRLAKWLRWVFCLSAAAVGAVTIGTRFLATDGGHPPASGAGSLEPTAFSGSGRSTTVGAVAANGGRHTHEFAWCRSSESQERGYSRCCDREFEIGGDAPQGADGECRIPLESAVSHDGDALIMCLDDRSGSRLRDHLTEPEPGILRTSRGVRHGLQQRSAASGRRGGDAGSLADNQRTVYVAERDPERDSQCSSPWARTMA